MAEVKFLGKGSLLQFLMFVLEKLSERAIINYFSDSISLRASDSDRYEFMAAVVRIKSSIFVPFRCPHIGHASMNITELVDKLSLDDHEDYSVTLSGEAEQLNVTIKLEAPGIEIIRETSLTDIHSGREYKDLMLEGLEYDVVIGISKERFFEIFNSQLTRGDDSVSIIVTDREVQFCCEGEVKVRLLKEQNECILGMVQGGQEYYFSFYLKFKVLFEAVSMLTDMVWILYGQNAPAMVNCPIKEFGQVMFYSLC